MDYLQYFKELAKDGGIYSFKPYYKWITFNMIIQNLLLMEDYSFKPYYKWITFNMINLKYHPIMLDCFKPYYKWITFNIKITFSCYILNSWF